MDLVLLLLSALKASIFRALLIAKKLKAKQGRKEENSVDKLAEKVNGHCYNIATYV